MMSAWKDNYRTLNCWQCFEAQGKMCHDKKQESLIKVTGSSNPGHAVCCKPGYSGAHCTTNAETICSQPAQKDDTSSDYKIVLSGDFNQQFFAFCPQTTASQCGTGTGTTADDENSLIIKALNNPQTITLDQANKKALKYIDGGQKTGRFESCFYEIRAGVINKKVKQSL